MCHPMREKLPMETNNINEICTEFIHSLGRFDIFSHARNNVLMHMADDDDCISKIAIANEIEPNWINPFGGGYKLSIIPKGKLSTFLFLLNDHTYGKNKISKL